MLGIDTSERMGTVRLIMSCWLLLLFFGLFAPPGHAQSTEISGPTIEIDELSNAVADSSQVFTVLIRERSQLREAVLYHRRAGQLPYVPATMQAVGKTGYYSVSIPTDSTDLRTIEYYVKAGDLRGNWAVSGFAFDPYRRTLTQAAYPLQNSAAAINAPAIPAGNTITDNTPSALPAGTPPLLQRRWVQIALGVLAVGVVANLASDSGDTETRIVPLTFNLQ